MVLQTEDFSIEDKDCPSRCNRCDPCPYVISSVVHSQIMLIESYLDYSVISWPSYINHFDKVFVWAVQLLIAVGIYLLRTTDSVQEFLAVEASEYS